MIFGKSGKPIHRVVMTGGVCSGKSTSLARISERLESLGYQVFRVPEAATILIMAGCLPNNWDLDRSIQFQRSIMDFQLTTEESILNMAKLADKPCVIIYDRGTMDGKAFCTEGIWQTLLEEKSLNEVQLRDSRYDAIIHLVTAAIGARQFYNLENNPARRETPDEAARMDELILNAWIGHPHVRVINNSTDFDDKVHRVIESILNTIGEPEPKEIERKYLVDRIAEIPVKYETVEIEQVYLGSSTRVRKRGRGLNAAYYHTIKREVSPGVRYEFEKQITSREYLAFLAEADPLRKPIRKTRTCFIWNERYYELDQFDNGLKLLELELDNLDEEVALPPFIQVSKDVTGDVNYSNSNLALK